MLPTALLSARGAVGSTRPHRCAFCAVPALRIDSAAAARTRSVLAVRRAATRSTCAARRRRSCRIVPMRACASRASTARSACSYASPTLTTSVRALQGILTQRCVTYRTSFDRRSCTERIVVSWLRAAVERRCAAAQLLVPHSSSKNVISTVHARLRRNFQNRSCSHPPEPVARSVALRGLARRGATALGLSRIGGGRPALAGRRRTACCGSGWRQPGLQASASQRSRTPPAPAPAPTPAFIQLPPPQRTLGHYAGLGSTHIRSR